ncbi:hypothetical protein EYF80_058525 [Liparis tanakae]|uniref:Uncharacterized protein n=1 Tax=Liparis tanakae TaxID=230148 RepID=A0A4Z2ESS6_9TELE|nr:hypothetical protein EYF80_058525 [Liparis tanakae]
MDSIWLSFRLRMTCSFMKESRCPASRRTASTAFPPRRLTETAARSSRATC